VVLLYTDTTCAKGMPPRKFTKWKKYAINTDIFLSEGKIAGNLWLISVRWRYKVWAVRH
jgi:hypothetical protein